ncbi:MAG: NUDIX domain-containing protein [Clostridiales bacterium]|nr:NUDIX domain-containing protein [Clostridiales bacterium]
MRLTTLCYIEREGAYLMLHRTKKENDQSHDKWLGVGGKFEDAESPEECMLREVREETGLILRDYAFRGIVTFVSDEWETEYMHLFTATFRGAEQISENSGEAEPVADGKDILRDCDEGVLEWVPKERVCSLNLWEGDWLFLERLNGSLDFFSLKVEYEGDRLIRWKFFSNQQRH